MGPTLSSVAWGCADQKEQEPELFDTPEKVRKASSSNNGHIRLQTDAQPGDTHDLTGATASPLSSADEEESINPVYQLSLCSSVKLPCSKETVQSKHQSKDVAGETLNPRISGSEQGEATASIVSVQPRSGAAGSDSDVQVSHCAERQEVSASSTASSDTSVLQNQREPSDRIVAEDSLTSDRTPPAEEIKELIPSSANTVAEDCVTALALDRTPPAEDTKELILSSQTMAAQVAPISGEVIPPVDNSASTSTDATSPAQDRLSSSESPEPSEAVGSTGSGKVAAVTKPMSNGSATAAAGPSGTKAEPDGKGATVKTKKKEDKSIEYILRALSSLNSPEEKLAALCKKYADLHEEHRVLQSSFKQQQRKMTVVQREKDQMQAEHTKAVIGKSKLESLCRELQKQNKVVKEESQLRTKEDEERRKEISAKFQTTITEIQAQMTDNHEKNVKLREENCDLAGKLKSFLEQYELREQQIATMAKHRDLENQLADAKLAQAAAILKEEQERNLKERELILMKATESQQKNLSLEAQLAMYKDRYEEFQVTISKSNEMFQKLKSEIDRMGKRIKKLEKEGAAWRAKCESGNRALLGMAEEKTRTDKDKLTLQIKVNKLESLCRALQGELHGKKAASPQPDDGASSAPAATVENADSTSTTTTATTTTSSTPPNTPEDSGSRASPGPDPTPSLPTGQNGPASVPAVQPDSSEASPSVPAAGIAAQENQVSSSAGVSAAETPAPPVEAKPEQVDCLSSSSDVAPDPQAAAGL